LTIVGTVLLLTKPQLKAFALAEFCTGQITTWSIRAQWLLHVPPDNIVPTQWMEWCFGWFSERTAIISLYRFNR